MRNQWSPFILVFTTLLALPARAQQESMHWHHDLESAKNVAKQSGRLVLVHFWTPSCAPCLALDQTVFNQPGVSAAIEAKFVPVKLNADENSATAQWYGITRVPTDVVITPDGQLVGKLVSPPTPMAYVADITALATKHAATSGSAFATAAAAAPAPPQINAAYAGLNIGPGTPLAIAPPNGSSNISHNSLAAFGTGAPSAGTNYPPANPAFTSVATPPVAPQLVTNPAAVNSAVGAAQPPITPSGQPPFAPPAAQVTNPYWANTAAVPPAQQPAAQPPTAPMPNWPAVGATQPVPQYGPPNAPAAPPLAAAAASPSTPPSAPDPSKLPPGSPPLGFDGYCPVSMRNSWKWVPGDPKWGIIHLGRTYWFAGPEEQQQFWTDPNRYTPALSGMDAVLAIDHKQNVPGKREHSLDYDGIFYMFASEATLQQFSANPQRYAASVRQAMGIPRGRLVR